MLKSVFSVERVGEDSKYYVYGTTLHSQILYINILMNGVDLNGYILEYNKTKVSSEFENHYNQELFNLTELSESDASRVNIIGILLSDEEISAIKAYGFNLIIPQVPESAVIYGAGDNCLKTKELLEACGCTVLAITDSYPERARLIIGDKAGVKIISREELKKYYTSEHIVVSVVRSKYKKEIEAWLTENKFDKTSCMENEYLRVNIDDREYKFTYKMLRQYFFENNWLRFGVNRFFLYGSKSWLEALVYFVNKCRIPIVVDCISADGFTGQCNGARFLSIYDLLTEDYGLYHVCVENDISTVLKAREQVIQLGLDKTRFSVLFNGRRLFWDSVIESRLFLMNDKKGYVLIKNPNKKADLRIGILGGSTSDPCLYNISSWSENLLDILETNGINAEVYNAAHSGYTVEDELLNISRYLLSLELDIIVSYSGINDMVRNYSYENIYAETFFDSAMKVMGKEEEGDATFLLPIRKFLKAKNSQEMDGYEENFDHARHWVDVQQMMHAICAERGIRYIGILQPTMLSKKPLTDTEMQWPYLFEYKLLKENVFLRMHMLWNELIKSTNWAYDFTGIFDDTAEEIFRDICHVTEAGNRIVAEKIAEVILK